MIEAVIFDLDGVLLASEEVWDEVRARYVRERGGLYDEVAQRAMMGMSAPEWSRYIHEQLGVPDPPERIDAEVVRRMVERYRRGLPLVAGARETVEELARQFPLGLASSSNRRLIDVVLELSGLAPLFRATVSSEEVARGKPAPDVYLEAARRLQVPPERCLAVEDSHAGIRSAKAAGMQVIAVPNPSYPPDPASLAEADIVVSDLAGVIAGVRSRADA